MFWLETLMQTLKKPILKLMVMETHSSILAWEIPWTEEPGRQQSTGSQRVGHDWSMHSCMGVINRQWMESCCCSAAQLCPTLCDPMNYSTQASLSLTVFQSLPKFMSIASVIPSSHLILWLSLLLLLSIFPSIKDFSDESAILIRWPKSWMES